MEAGAPQRDPGGKRNWPAWGGSREPAEARALAPFGKENGNGPARRHVFTETLQGRVLTSSNLEVRVAHRRGFQVVCPGVPTPHDVSSESARIAGGGGGGGSGISDFLTRLALAHSNSPEAPTSHQAGFQGTREPLTAGNTGPLLQDGE